MARAVDAPKKKKKNNFNNNFLILINLICHELLVDYKITKITSASSRKPIITKYRSKSLFLPRVAEFIYIEGDNNRVCLLLEL